VVDLDVSPDGKLLVVYRVASTLHSLWLADLSTGEQTAIFIYDVPLVAPTFSADGTQIFVSTLEGRVFVLDISR
jgi:Tol biopolymer transport system component